MLNKEAWQLRLKAGAVRYFVQRVGLALLGGPEFAGVSGYVLVVNGNAIGN
jgi:hypothetical protein